MTAAPEFVPARTPKMRQVYLGSCGHIVLNAGSVDGDHCYQCDPTYEQANMGVVWRKLYVQRAADAAGAA